MTKGLVKYFANELLMSYNMQKLSTNEVFSHFLEFGLLDGLDNVYDGSPKCLSTMSMVRGHANFLCNLLVIIL